MAGLVAGVVVLAMMALAADGPGVRMGATTMPGVARGAAAAIVDFQGEIDEYSLTRFEQRMEEAKAAGAKVVIVNIDSPGGLVTASLEISRYIRRQDGLHTIAYIQDKAYSGAAMVAMACDEIVMSDSAALGDCAPIIFSPDMTALQALPPAERAKQEGPIRKDFDDSATRNHHDPLLAAAMVSVQVEVHWLQSPDGSEKRFVDKDDAAHLRALGWTTVAGAKEPIDSDTTLLTVDSEEAIRYGLATGPVASAEALANDRGYKIVDNLRETAGDELVEVLASPATRGLILLIFLTCGYVVLHAPGHGVPEVLGVIALGLMLGVPMLTGYGQWWEILLVFVGLALVGLEILVPGHFVPGIVGGILTLSGLVLTFVPREPTGMPGFLPSLGQTWTALEHGLLAVSGAFAASLLLMVWLNRFLPSLPYLRRLVLTETSGGHVDGAADVSATMGPPPTWPMVGSVGRAASELKPGGSAVFFDPAVSSERQVAVISDAGFVPPGTSVVVREVAGNRVIIHPC